MNIRDRLVLGIRNPIIAILSAFLAFKLPLSVLLLHNHEYEKINWIIDLAIYTYIVGLLYDLIVDFLDSKKTIIEFEFINKDQEVNQLLIKDDKDIKTVYLKIKVTGKWNKISDILRIVEPGQLTIQFTTLPDYIRVNGDSIYEINLNKIIGGDKFNNRKSKGNLDMSRECKFDITLDDYENEYSDFLEIERTKLHWWNSNLIMKQTKICVKGKGS